MLFGKKILLPLSRLGLFKHSVRPLSSAGELINTIVTNKEQLSLVAGTAAAATTYLGYAFNMYQKRKTVAEQRLILVVRQAGSEEFPEDFDAKMKGADLNGKDSIADTALHHACTQGNKLIVRALLSMGAKPDIENIRGETALYQAAFAGHLSVIDIFLDVATQYTTGVILSSKISIAEIVNQRTKTGWTPLLAAMFNNHTKVATKLITHGAAIDVENIKGENPLLFAVMHNNIQLVQFILFNADISDETVKRLIDHEDNGQNGTPLYIAAEKGFVEIVELLLRRGAKNKPSGKYKQTPLHVALTNGHDAVAERLSKDSEAFIHVTPDGWSVIDYIAYRALRRQSLISIEREILKQYFFEKEMTPDYAMIVNYAKNRFKNDTVLHDSILLGILNTVMELIKNDVDIHSTRSDGSSPLLTAAFFKQTEIALYLIDQECDINAVNCRGESALYYAILNNDLKLAEKLCAKGINVRHIDNQGYSYMHIVAKHGSAEMAQLLLRNNALRDPKTDNFRNFPIHIAAIAKNIKVLEVLLKWGADPDARNINNLTAEQLARNDKNIRALLENARQFDTDNASSEELESGCTKMRA